MVGLFRPVASTRVGVVSYDKTLLLVGWMAKATIYDQAICVTESGIAFCSQRAAMFHLMC